MATVREPSEIVTALRHPNAYPWRPATVDLVETHLSWVFLAGDRVVKVKRPVDLGFVDHTTLHARRHACREEVRLNRRLTTGVYLDVVPITHDGRGYSVAGEGPAVEWATLMRRRPAEGMLDALLARGTAPGDIADRLAGRLIPFHRHAAKPCPVAAHATVAATVGVVTENLDQLAPFAGPVLGRAQLGLIDAALRSFASDRREVLEQRVAAGWIRDGQGDLRAEHVCLDGDGAVQIFDCVEFSPAIRCADVASDLAFLLMDLDRICAGPVAASLAARYREAGIPLPDDLVRFYRAHRALVRAKVALLRRGETGDPAPAWEAAAYLNEAARAALTARPALIVMTGLSGTGKSTVARALARALGAAHLASDAVRKELAGVTGPAPAAWQAGIYSAGWTDQTYRRLHGLAAETLAGGAPAILDATYLDPGRRASAQQIAARLGVPLLLVESVCAEETALRRIAARERAGGSRSDAGADVYRRQRRAMAESPPPPLAGAIAIRVDTGSPGPVDIGAVLLAPQRTGSLAPEVPIGGG